MRIASFALSELTICGRNPGPLGQAIDFCAVGAAIEIVAAWRIGMVIAVNAPRPLLAAVFGHSRSLLAGFANAAVAHGFD